MCFFFFLTAVYVGIPSSYNCGVDSMFVSWFRIANRINTYGILCKVYLLIVLYELRIFHGGGNAFACMQLSSLFSLHVVHHKHASKYELLGGD